MPATLVPARRGLAAAAAALLTLAAACGGGEPSHPPLRVSDEAPLPAAGDEERAPPPAEDGSLAPAPGGLATFVATLPARAVIDPRPALPDPAGRRRSDDPKAFTPRLTGRTADGEDVLELPLAHTRVVAQVSGNVARVEVTQYYVNPSPDRLEAIYAFPLPPNAAVTDMAFRIGSRVVVSEVKRREEARRTYEAAREEGRTAALTEQERPNLFTQSVANVPPGDTVAVVLRYVHEVPYDDGRYLFHFPTTIGPRYVPGAPAGAASGPGWSPDTDRVPDGSRVTPPVVPPGRRSAADVDILVRLVPAAAFDDVVAKSHRVVTGVDAGGARLVALAEDDRVPDKDLVLSWRPAGGVPSAHAIVQRERGEEFLMLFLQPPADVAPALVRPKELVFLLDKSGSMMGAPIERAKALVDRALRALGPDDTFQIVAFDGVAQAMTAAPVPGTPDDLARARRWLARLSGGGGTEMLAGIRAALTAPSDPRRLRMVVFCTDGFIGNETEIVEAVEALRGPARVFGFGVGSSVNRYLVEGVARAGRGASEVVDLKEPPDAAVARLFGRLDRPVLTDLEVSFEGPPVSDLLPARLPDLFAGQPLVVAGRLHGGAPGAVVLRGRLGERPYEARVPLAVGALGPDPSGTAQPVAGTLWARRRIDDLLSARPTAPSAQAVEEIVRHALRFKLVTPYTSFVAVARELRVDPGLPLARALVPNELPEGVSHEGIFGPGSVEVLPARVKPGDPELRVDGGPGAVAVRVVLPFERAEREAIRDEARGDWVLRFLVPPGWPDGSWDARITIVHRDGEVEERSAPIRVDTTPAAIAVVAAPTSALRGEQVRLALKPALPLSRLGRLSGRPGGLGNAAKGAMEVKDVLVRAPWGEIARARMEGPLGAYVAVLRVPGDAPEGRADLEIVASDAAGNVSRRRIALAIGGGPTRGERATAYAGMGGVAAVVAIALGALVGAALLRGRRRPRPPGLVLLSASVRSARAVVGPARCPGVSLQPSLRTRGASAPEASVRARRALALALVAVLAALALAGAARQRGKARHLAVPVLADPSLPVSPGAELAEGPTCAARGLARVGARITALLVASDGDLWIGTFDAGLFRAPAPGRVDAASAAAAAEEGGALVEEVPGLRGRERFVNALAEHDGVVWAATQGGLLALDGDRRALTLLAGEGVTALARAGGALHAGTARGPFRVSISAGAEALEVAGPSGEPLRVTALAAGPEWLWIGTPSGAYSVPLATLAAPLLSREARWHPLVFGEPPSETNVVTALAPLADGAVAGTDDGGLVRVRGDGRVAALRFADARANEVNPGAAAATLAGPAVLGTQGGGLLLARARDGGLEAIRVGGARGQVSAVLALGGRILVGTASGTVSELQCGSAPDGAAGGRDEDGGDPPPVIVRAHSPAPRVSCALPARRLCLEP